MDVYQSFPRPVFKRVFRALARHQSAPFPLSHSLRLLRVRGRLRRRRSIGREKKEKGVGVGVTKKTSRKECLSKKMGMQCVLKL